MPCLYCFADTKRARAGGSTGAVRRRLSSQLEEVPAAEVAATAPEQEGEERPGGLRSVRRLPSGSKRES